MGMGDILMSIGDARVLFKNNPARRVAIGNGKQHKPHELYYGLPYIASQGDLATRKVQWVISDNSLRPYVDYDKMRELVQQRSGRKMRNRHLVGILGYYLWHKTYRATPAEFVMQPNEERLFDKWRGREFVTIEPHLKPRAPSAKDWTFERYQQVVDKLSKHIEVVQISAPGTQSLNGASRVNLNFRESLALMKASRLYVGPEGGFHHGAAAVGRPAVVLFGGYISPKTTGYETHKNLVGDPHPCGRKIGRCKHCEIAMGRITPAMVLAEINSVLDLGPKATYVDSIASGQPGIGDVP